MAAPEDAGQGGIQSGISMWELLCTEHALRQDGRMDMDGYDFKLNKDEMRETLPTFFDEKPGEKYSPRAVLMDTESTTLNGIRCGFHNMYDLNKIISGKEEAVSFARGFYSCGSAFLEPTMDVIRKAADECENLQAVILLRSLGGGTGSGFGSLLMESVAQEFSKKSRIEYAILQGEGNTIFPSILEPYNCILGINSSIDLHDCSFMISNRSLSNICQKKLAMEMPTFPEFNKLLAQAISYTTAPFRFHNTLNISITEFQVNLFPFPKAHFPIVGFAPILRQKKVFHEPLSVNSITLEGLEKNNQMMECDLSRGSFIACCLFYRGDITPSDINASIDMLKNKKKCINFIDCCPTGFKVGLNTEPAVMPNNWQMVAPIRSVCTISNNTSVTSCWKQQSNSFDLLYSRRAFLHWFLEEGMDENEFIESRNNVETIMNEYAELQKSPSSEYSE